MKSFLMCLCLAVIASSGFGQRSSCSTYQSQDMFDRLEWNLKNADKTIEKGYAPRVVPVKFHIVADTDGSNAMSEDILIAQLCKLNDRYELADIFFYIDEINYIFCTNCNRRPRLSSSVSTFRNAKSSSAMNLFLVTEILQNDGSPSGSAGYYSGGNNDYMVMLKTQLGNDRFTIEHEIGHFFSLPHTHVGWEGDISQGATSGGYQPSIHGDTVRIQVISGSTQAGSVEVELMDKSNCTTAGDRICDTPPDYGFGQSCACCTMVYDVWDRNGDKIEPMIDNVMSYSEGCDPFLFSAEQIITMQTDIDSPSRAYLRNGDITEYTPIPNPVDIISPLDGQTYDDYNGVLIEWEPIAEADYYRVNLSGTQQLSYETTDSELFITELRPNAAYFLDVYGVNAFGTGCQPITRRFFATGTGLTAVNELDYVTDINIFPNPADRGNELELNFVSTKSSNATIRISSINGQVLNQRSLSIKSGLNRINIETTLLNPGLHLVELETREGILVRKVIIE